jgi:hypothetical protein
MKYAAATLALVAGATAHTVMSEIYIDGKGQGSGTCVREPINPVGAVDPVTDLGSSDMACGKDGTKGVARTCGMNGGQEITFEYRQWPDDPSKQSLAWGHMGPCAVYLKKVEDATTDGATGDGWFKLWDEGYDESSGKWCTQKMIENKGRISVTIPDSLAGGDYLVRPELLALHNIAVKNQPEYYLGCAQVHLSSSGSAGPESTVSIPGYTSMSDSANQYNAFDKPLKPFTVQGPKVFKPTNNNQYFSKSMTKQSTGLKPDNCILTNANWCGVEIPDYSDEEGCWKADKDCWAQLDECWDSAPSTGGANCKIWEQKCKNNQGMCKSGGSGPYNKGQSLEPEADYIGTPAAVNGGMNYGSSGSSNSDSDSSYEAPSSSAAPSSTAAAKASSAPDSYKQKGKAPASYDQGSNNNNNQESAPQYTSAPEYKPAPSKAPATTMVTKAKDNGNNGGNNVVVETVYQTVNAYTTVYDNAVVTETAGPAHYRRHLARHLHN